MADAVPVVSTRRGRRYNQSEVDAAVRRVVDQNVRLMQENQSLKARNAGLLAQLADAEQLLMKAYAGADEAFGQFETLARECGRLDAMAAHPSRHTGEASEVPPARLRLVSPVTSTEGEQ